MKAAAAYIIQADEATQKSLGVLMPHMLDVNMHKRLFDASHIYCLIFFVALVTYYCCSR